MPCTAEEVEKGANADTTYQVDKQGTAAEEMKIVNDEGVDIAVGDMVEESYGNVVEDDDGTADWSAVFSPNDRDYF